MKAERHSWYAGPNWQRGGRVGERWRMRVRRVHHPVRGSAGAVRHPVRSCAARGWGVRRWLALSGQCQGRASQCLGRARSVEWIRQGVRHFAGTVSDICLADVANLCDVSDICPLSRSVSLLLSDTSMSVDGKVTTLSDTPTEMSDTPTEVSDTTTAVRAYVSAACVRLSGLSATGADVSERFGDARRCPVEVERVSAEELGQPMLDGGGQFRVGGGDAQ